MLSEKEINERVMFYGRIFSKMQMHRGNFPDKLWPIASYDAKINGLRKRGFANPQKLITSLPQILGLSFDNIDAKIKKARRLGVTDVFEFIDVTIVFVGMSAKHYVPLIRACRKLSIETSPRNIFNMYCKKKHLDFER